MNTPTGESLPAVIADPPVETAPVAMPTITLCANCGAELLGAYCYSCGQPVKGMIRPLSNMLSDIADTIFNIDSRIFRTLVPLYYRPGYLSIEYFAGRRVRFVTPFRLYFFLSIAAFFAIQIAVDDIGANHIVEFDADGSSSVSAALTTQEVVARRDAALAALAKAKAAPVMPNVAGKEMDKASAKIRDEADKRLAWLKSVDDAKASGKPPPPDPQADKNRITFGKSTWDPQKDPVHIGWLPDIANAKLNTMGERMLQNLQRLRKDPKPFLVGAFGALSPVLFVLMPVFALLLKIFYIFKRRLYMEHLIVALHSHSFIFLSLLLITLAVFLQGWAHTAAPWLESAFSWLIVAMGWWMPIYLLIMQKRVYQQGWFFTILKYCTIGIGYVVMISIGIAAAFVVSLATV
jgi:hypothetical protein